MNASVIERTTDSIVVQIQIPLNTNSLLDSEESIQMALNEAVTIATAEAIR
jgi:hypothetical protein